MGRDKPILPDGIILVIGQTGAGKSTFISRLNIISEKKPEVGHNLNACTDVVEAYEIKHNHPDKYKDIHIVDTPGFNADTSNTGAKDALLWARIVVWVAREIGGKCLTGILYLHDISQASTAPTTIACKSLCKILGDKLAVCAISHWKDNDKDHETRFNSLKKESQSLHVMKFDDKGDSAQQIFDTMLSRDQERKKGVTIPEEKIARLEDFIEQCETTGAISWKALVEKLKEFIRDIRKLIPKVIKDFITYLIAIFTKLIK